MKKILFLFSFILLESLAGCAHNTPNSNFNTPITLPIETIKSNGSVIHQPFSKDKIALLEKELENIIMATGARGISASIGVPEVMGVIDGFKTKGIETEADIVDRKEFLRKIGYKL